MLPTTGELAFVQIKCRTTQDEFDGYVQEFEKRDAYVRMFFVYHTGPTIRCDTGRTIHVIDGRKIAEMTVDAGLADWVIQKAS